MKTVHLVTTLLVLIMSAAFAQQQALEIKKVFGGVKVMQGGQLLRMNQLHDIMKSNSEAFAVFKKAKSNNGVASVFGAVGGGLIGWPLGTAAGGGDPNWGLAGVGAGFILLAIPFGASSGKHMIKAVDIYNGKNSAAGWMPVKMYVGASPEGVRLQLRF